MAPNKTKMAEMSEQLTELMMSYDRETALATLFVTLPIYWCNGDNMNTITEAVDRWRLMSLEIEKGIRQCFGAIRYGDDDNG